MNRNILLAVSAAALMGTLWAESPLNLQIHLGQAPTLVKEEPKQAHADAKPEETKQKAEKSQPKIAETDLEGRLKAIGAKLDADLNALLNARNKEIAAYKTRLFAHFEKMLKETQESGDLDAYEKWNDRKERFQKLRTFDNWAMMLSYVRENWRSSVNKTYFNGDDLRETSAPDFNELYSDSIKKAYQAADKAMEEVQRDALKQGNIKAATGIREWRRKTLPRNEATNRSLHPYPGFWGIISPTIF